MMNETNSRHRCESLLEDLQKQRDEIKVQMHLADMEVRDEWQKLEKKWDHLKGKKSQLVKDLHGSCKDIGLAIDHLVNELDTEYKNMRKRL